MSRRDGNGKAAIVGRAGVAAQARGEAAEALAAAHLARHGVRVLARRVRCRGGEIDLVGLDGTTLVFVEVRLRARGRFGDAAASITTEKQRRVALAAHWWLTHDGRTHAGRPMRFDAVLLERLEPASIQWLRGAFEGAPW